VRRIGGLNPNDDAGFRRMSYPLVTNPSQQTSALLKACRAYVALPTVPRDSILAMKKDSIAKEAAPVGKMAFGRNLGTNLLMCLKSQGKHMTVGDSSSSKKIAFDTLVGSGTVGVSLR